MRKVFLKLLITLCAFAHASLGSSQSESPRGVNILNHTKTIMSVYRGDKIRLKASVKGEQVRFRWVRKDQVVCSAEECLLDTAGWGLGKHLIVFVAYNKESSRYVRYNIFVLDPSPEFQPRTLEPEVVSANAQEELFTSNDLTIQALTGQAYSYTKEKVVVVGQNPRRVEWNEALRTSSQSTMVLTQGEAEEHFVLPSSQVSLRKSETDRRLLVLDRGTLRSRVLGRKSVPWSILAGDSIQIDGDTQMDAIIERSNVADNRYVQVTCLRGTVRVVSVSDNQDSGPAEIFLSPTQSVRIEETGVFSGLVIPDTDAIAKAVRNSTPHYLPATKSNSGIYAYGKFVLGNNKAETARESPDAKKAGEAFNAGDSIATIEYLVAHIAKAKTDYEIAMMLADSYRNVYLYKEAFAIYRLADKLKPKNYRPSYEIGRIFARSQMWELAVKWLEVSASKTLPASLSQEVDYTVGVSYFWLKSWNKARGRLRLAAWSKDSEEISLSAEKFLALIDKEKSWNIRVSLGLGYDQNPLHISDSASSPEGMEKKASLALLGAFDGSWKFLRFNQGSLGVGFDAHITRYTESMFSKLAWLDERLYFNSEFSLMNQDGQAWMNFKLIPYLKLVYVGGQRADDVYGLTWGLEFPTVKLSPSLSMNTSLHQDPLPANDDKLDPITLEYVVPSERSQRYNLYELNLTVISSIKYKLDVQLDYEKQSFRNTYVSRESYQGYGLEILSRVALRPKMNLLPNLKYFLRSYPNSSDSRKDTIMNPNLSLEYYYSGTMFQDLTIDYLSNSSSRDTNTYTRTFVKSGITLDF